MVRPPEGDLKRTPWGVTLKPVPRTATEKTEKSELDMLALQMGKLGKIRKKNMTEAVVSFYVLLL